MRLQKIGHHIPTAAASTVLFKAADLTDTYGRPVEDPYPALQTEAAPDLSRRHLVEVFKQQFGPYRPLAAQLFNPWRNIDRVRTLVKHLLHSVQPLLISHRLPASIPSNNVWHFSGRERNDARLLLESGY